MVKRRKRLTPEQVTLIIEYVHYSDGGKRTSEEIAKYFGLSVSTVWKHRKLSVIELKKIGIILSREQKKRIQYAINNPGKILGQKEDQEKVPMGYWKRQTLVNRIIHDDEIIKLYNKEIKRSGHVLIVDNLKTLVNADSDLEEIVTFDETTGTSSCNRTTLKRYLNGRSDYFIDLVEKEIFKTEEEEKEHVLEPLFEEIKGPARDPKDAEKLNSYLQNLSSSLNALELARNKGISKTIKAKLADAKSHYIKAQRWSPFFYDHGLDERFERLEERFKELKKSVN